MLIVFCKTIKFISSWPRILILIYFWIKLRNSKIILKTFFQYYFSLFGDHSYQDLQLFHFLLLDNIFLKNFNYKLFKFYVYLGGSAFVGFNGEYLARLSKFSGYFTGIFSPIVYDLVLEKILSLF